MLCIVMWVLGGECWALGVDWRQNSDLEVVYSVEIQQASSTTEQSTRAQDRTPEQNRTENTEQSRVENREYQNKYTSSRLGAVSCGVVLCCVTVNVRRVGVSVCRCVTVTITITVTITVTGCAVSISSRRRDE